MTRTQERLHAVYTGTERKQEPRLHQMTAVAERLGIGRTAVFELIKEGRLKSVKLAGRRLVSESEICRFIDALEASTSTSGDPEVA